MRNAKSQGRKSHLKSQNGQAKILHKKDTLLIFLPEEHIRLQRLRACYNLLVKIRKVNEHELDDKDSLHLDEWVVGDSF